MSWAAHVTRREKKRNSYIVQWEIRIETDVSEDLGVTERILLK
jgi:hypothetical protein